GHPQGKERTTIKGFSAFMVSPKSELTVTIPETLGNEFVISYVNDYGGYMDIKYQCIGNTCKAVKEK
ncbi:MAG: hypothetical protein ACRDAP_19045, partial [Shewanella sp.]